MNPNTQRALQFEGVEAAAPADDDRLHTQFAAFTAFAMTVIAIAAGFAVLY